MREILFRGKAINRRADMSYCSNYKDGDWVYGLVTKPFDKRFPKLPAEMRNTDGISRIEVDYRTVGQYTGLTDKNGNKIFEGDIVQGEAEEARGVVEWQQAEGRYLVSVRNGYDWLCMDDDDWCVIGNIHDNPKLLSRG